MSPIVVEVGTGWSEGEEWSCRRGPDTACPTSLRLMVATLLPVQLGSGVPNYTLARECQGVPQEPNQHYKVIWCTLVMVTFRVLCIE